MKNLLPVIFIIITVIAVSCKGNSTPKAPEAQSSAYTRIEEKPRLYNRTMYISAEGGLRMRDKPSTDGNKIVTIPDSSEVWVIEETGDEITISGKTGKWAKVKYKGDAGWVFGGFLETEIKLETITKFQDCIPATEDLNIALEKGVCSPFLYNKSDVCTIGEGAPCFEGIILKNNKEAIVGGCDGGQFGTWKYLDDDIIIQATSRPKADCIYYCEMDNNLDDEKTKACIEKAGCNNLAESKTIGETYNIIKKDNKYFISQKNGSTEFYCLKYAK